MGIFKPFAFVVAYTILISGICAQAKMSADVPVQDAGGGLDIPASDLVIPGSPNFSTEGQIQTSGNCSSWGSDGGQAGAICYGMPTDSDEKKDEGDEAKTADKDNKKSESDDSEAKKRAEAEAAACRSQYQSALSACEGAISSAGNSCDSSQSSALNSAASDAQSSKNTDDTFAASCGEAQGVSKSAQQAMTVFRQNCAGGVTTCRSTCDQLTSFLRSKPNCYEAIGHTSSSAQSMASSKSSTCESYQAKVNEADRAISSYASTAKASAACEAAATGGQGGGQPSNYSSIAFCQSNPNYPGCSSGSTVNCASDPSNLVCVCSANSSDSRCSSTGSGSESSSNVASNDSSSRISTASGSGGNNSDVPEIQLGRISKSSGSSQAVDGRQSTADLGNSPVVAAAKKDDGLSKQELADQSFLSMLAGLVGLDDGDGGGGTGAGTSGNAAGAAVTTASASVNGSRVPANAGDGKQATPDLRQFLPGGISNPFANGVVGSSARVGQDGITGPHSNIWHKIQNRYQVIQGTLEP